MSHKTLKCLSRKSIDCNFKVKSALVVITHDWLFCSLSSNSLHIAHAICM